MGEVKGNGENGNGELGRDWVIRIILPAPFVWSVVVIAACVVLLTFWVLSR